jgi:hypothetical protein
VVSEGRDEVTGGNEADGKRSEIGCEQALERGLHFKDDGYIGQALGYEGEIAEELERIAQALLGV